MTPNVAEHARAHGLLCLALATYQNPGLRSLQSTPEHVGCCALLWHLIRFQDSEGCRASQNTWVALPCFTNLSEYRTQKVAEQTKANGLLRLALATNQNPGYRRLQNKQGQGSLMCVARTPYLNAGSIIKRNPQTFTP